VTLLISLLITLFVTQSNATPQAAADDLLAADRAFAAASEKTDLITGIAAIFAPDVAMPAPGGVVYGSQKAIEALKANPANAGAKSVWTPARVAISGDGQHGFTAGFMTITRADGSVAAAKYLAYWEKQSAGWRVLAYKRVPAKDVPANVKVTYLLPTALVAARTDRAAIDRDRDGLSNAEKSFAAEAQQMGLGAAFKKYGSTDAINLGGPATPTFAWGNDEIAALVGQNAPPTGSSVNWGPEKAIVASSGDFGVTIGYITPNAAPGAAPRPPSPFFTIWRKEAGGWRYIAE
jgi:ketosteroid isomerase-like protein